MDRLAPPATHIQWSRRHHQPRPSLVTPSHTPPAGTHATARQTDGIYSSGQTNMIYGEQVVNKGLLLVEEKGPHP